MYIVKSKKNAIINISDDFAYQGNGNLLIRNGKLAISKHLIGEIIETDIIPDGWECVDGVYQKIIIHPTEDELRQDGAEAVTLELIERGIL